MHFCHLLFYIQIFTGWFYECKEYAESPCIFCVIMDLSAKGIDFFAEKCNLKRSDNKRALLSRLWITSAFVTGIGLSGGLPKRLQGSQDQTLHFTSYYVFLIVLLPHPAYK